MDNMSGSEQSNSVSQTSQRYEQNEVVWAKIQGYPWWPAYIGEIEDSQDEGIIYKVYFFGDNSHSRLNSQKIRKFQDFFQNFSLIAKKNSRLKQALVIAQQQLIENKEDVSYFGLRSQNKKRLENRTQSNHQDMGSNSKKIIESQDHIASSNLQAQAKRGRGRPKKQNIIKLLGVQNGVAKIQMIQNDEPQSTLVQNQTPKKQQNIQIKPVPQTYDQSQKKIISQAKSNKKVNKQIERVKHLIQKSFYKQGLNLMVNFQITFENVMDVLDSQVLRKLEEKIKIRSLLRLKDKIKKILLDKYFKSRHFAPIFQYKAKDTIRAKAIRKIFTLLKRIHSREEAKQLAIKLQEDIESGSNRDNIKYMESMTTLIKKISQNTLQIQQSELKFVL